MAEDENWEDKVLTELAETFAENTEDLDFALVVTFDRDFQGWKVQAMSQEDQITSAACLGKGSLSWALAKVFTKLEADIRKYREVQARLEAELLRELGEDED